VRGVEIELPLHGRHMVGNAISALAACDAAGVPLEEAAGGLAKTVIPGGRSEMSEIEGVTVINDCYNANPASLRAALDLLRDIRGSRRAIVVVGSMRELGPDAEALHREAAKAVVAMGPDVVAAVGDFAKAFRELGADAEPITIVAGVARRAPGNPVTVALAVPDPRRRGALDAVLAAPSLRIELLAGEPDQLHQL